MKRAKFGNSDLSESYFKDIETYEADFGGSTLDRIILLN
jgi:hypothetical protein